MNAMKKSSRLGWLSATAAFASLMAAAACVPERPFQFDLSAEEPFEAHVTLDGEPLRFANVIVADALIPDPDGRWMEEPSGGSVYFRGTTGPEGRVSANVRIPTRVDAVDLVVDRVGATGPYTSESLREYWGPFAPSSRITLGRGFLSQLQVDLESD